MFKIYKSFKFVNTCLILSTTVLLTGCFATIFSNPTQTIQMQVVDSQGNLLEGVKCTARLPESGVYYSLTSNPGQITAQRGSGLLFVNCKKAGYEQSDVMVGEDFNKVTLLNVIWLPGFAVDAITGAYKQYPSHYIITMRESAGS